ncbi:unnamed protein product [Brugia pahangi]|uniref:Peptidase S1 domain-containing protein n=1 Tax=Brugia pahangi TaxID=6280 RepID=A0A0N4T9V2_BRUPA|nr:unnamed protein product [Brugia pahangi]
MTSSMAASHASTCNFHLIRAGDSGGGLQGFVKQRVFLLGVHSFGPKTCYSGSPFTVTDTRPYAQLMCDLTGICYHLSPLK